MFFDLFSPPGVIYLSFNSSELNAYLFVRFCEVLKRAKYIERTQQIDTSEYIFLFHAQLLHAELYL